MNWDSVERTLSQVESESTWKSMSDCLGRLQPQVAQVTPDAWLLQLRRFLRPRLISCLLSERTRLSGSACELVDCLARHLALAVPAALWDPILQALLKLCTRANRVFSQRAGMTMETLIECCHVPLLCHRLVDSAQPTHGKVTRQWAMQGLVCLLRVNSLEELGMVVEEVEAGLRLGLLDAESTVRELARQAYQLYYQPRFTQRAHLLERSLPANAQKYLNTESGSSTAAWTAMRSQAKKKPSETSTPVKSSSTTALSASHHSTTGKAHPKLMAAHTHGTLMGAARVLATNHDTQPPLTGISLGRTAAASTPSVATTPVAMKQPLSSTVDVTLSTVAGAHPVMKPAARRLFMGSTAASTTHTGHSINGTGASMTGGEGGSGVGKPLRVPAGRVALRGMSASAAMHGEEGSSGPLSGMQGLKKGPMRVLVHRPQVVEKKAGPASSSDEKGKEAESQESTVMRSAVEREEHVVAASGKGKESVVQKAKESVVHKGKVSKSMVREEVSDPIPVLPAVVNTETAEDLYQDAMKSVTKQDWAARCKAYETLQELVSHRDAELEKHARTEINKWFLDGLLDHHFRIVKIALDTCLLLIQEGRLSVQAHHDVLVPRLLAIAEDPQLKSKLSIRETARALLTSIQKHMDPAEFVGHLFNLLNSPEYSKNVRVRHGAIDFLYDTFGSVKVQFLEKLSSFRTVLSRLASCHSDSERALNLKLAKILVEAHAVHSDLFFDALSYLSVGDRKIIRELVSKKIKDYLKLEDRAVNARRFLKNEKASVSSGKVSKSSAGIPRPTSAPVSKKSPVKQTPAEDPVVDPSLETQSVPDVETLLPAVGNATPSPRASSALEHRSSSKLPVSPSMRRQSKIPISALVASPIRSGIPLPSRTATPLRAVLQPKSATPAPRLTSPISRISSSLIARPQSARKETPAKADLSLMHMDETPRPALLQIVSDPIVSPYVHADSLPDRDEIESVDSAIICDPKENEMQCAAPFTAEDVARLCLDDIIFQTVLLDQGIPRDNCKSLLPELEENNEPVSDVLVSDEDEYFYESTYADAHLDSLNDVRGLITSAFEQGSSESLVQLSRLIDVQPTVVQPFVSKIIALMSEADPNQFSGEVMMLMIECLRSIFDSFPLECQAFSVDLFRIFLNFGGHGSFSIVKPLLIQIVKSAQDPRLFFADSSVFDFDIEKDQTRARLLLHALLNGATTPESLSDEHVIQRLSDFLSRATKESNPSISELAHSFSKQFQHALSQVPVANPENQNTLNLSIC